jgi:hypothetical protein
MLNISINSQEINRETKQEYKLTEVVWTFYHHSNKSYKVNKLAGRKSFNTPKSY